MNMFILVLFLPPIIFMNVRAQDNNNHQSVQDALRNFEPSLAIVIGILSILFSLTFLLLVYAKFCHRSAAPEAASAEAASVQVQEGLGRSRSLSSGVDRTVVESLPLFRFSSLKGSRDGLECAVCLSRFEDVEILRLLPKCKHAFHIGCIDQWLQKHSTCPLCRQKISSDDLASLQYSRSLRFLWKNQSELREDSSVELHIHRLEKSQSWSSRFRKSGNQNLLHKLNHKINIVSADVVLKNRWSNVSSSDLMLLTSEMIHDSTSSRFSSLDRNTTDHHSSMATRVIEEENSNQELFETSKIKKNNDCCPSSSSSESRKVSKSMSEIVIHPRFRDSSNGSRELSDLSEDGKNVNEERRRKAWIPIARKTVEWFATRERSTLQSHNTRLSLNV